MNRYLPLLVLILLPSFLCAQIPKYKFTSWSGSGSVATSNFHAKPPVKWQFIYMPYNFPGMPVGPVTAVYLRIGRIYSSDTSFTFPNFRVKLGYTSMGDTTFPNIGQWDTFKTGLTAVRSSTNYTITGADSVGKWIKIPIDQSFVYTADKPFVVEVSRGDVGVSTYGFGWAASNYTPGRRRALSGHQDSLRSFNGSGQSVADIGFDVYTVGVEGYNLFSSFGLFPNPTNGRFNVSFTTNKRCSTADVIITDGMGAKLVEETFSINGKSFFQEFNLSAASKGIYFVSIKIDGQESITRKIIID